MIPAAARMDEESDLDAIRQMQMVLSDDGIMPADSPALIERFRGGSQPQAEGRPDRRRPHLHQRVRVGAVTRRWYGGRTHYQALTLHDVVKRFGTHLAVDRINLDIAAGTFVSIVGPSGCGKSTLLNIIAGLLPTSSGRVDVFGEPLTGINARATYMFQQDALLPWKTVLGNIQFGLTLRARTDATPWRRPRPGSRGSA
jgi:ABC-type glutathione transport system ATPase component